LKRKSRLGANGSIEVSIIGDRAEPFKLVKEENEEPARHSREGGNLVGLSKMHFILLDSRLTEGQPVLSLSKGGNDGMGVMNYGNINSQHFLGSASFTG